MMKLKNIYTLTLVYFLMPINYLLAYETPQYEYYTSSVLSFKQDYSSPMVEFFNSDNFSFKQAFISTPVQYFHSPIFYAVNTPDVDFTLNEKTFIHPISVGTNDSLKLNINFSPSEINNSIRAVTYQIKSLDSNRIYPLNKVDVVDEIVSSRIDISNLDEGNYIVKVLFELENDLVYIVESPTINVTNIKNVEFTAPSEWQLKKSYLSIEFFTIKGVNINTYDLFYTDEYGNKITIASNVSAKDTFVSKDEAGNTYYKYLWKIDDSIAKRFNIGIQIIN